MLGSLRCNFIDFEKAFDFLEWPFIQKALSAFNFGPDILKWFNVFYRDIQSCVLNLGWSTGWFNLERGVRQGCPLSTALFVISVELLAIAVRNSKNIHGIRLPFGIEHVISLFADDTTMCLQDNVSLKNCILL